MFYVGADVVVSSLRSGVIACVFVLSSPIGIIATQGCVGSIMCRRALLCGYPSHMEIVCM